MTPARARELSALFLIPEAAVWLLPVSCSPERSELRGRAAAALRALDPDAPPPEPVQALDVAAWGFARCLTELATTASRDRRRRLAPLLAAVCAEAARLERGRA